MLFFASVFASQIFAKREQCEYQVAGGWPLARGITLRPSSRPDRVADRSRMKFSNAMMDWYRLAKVGLLLQIGVLAFGQAQAQLAPPPPPAKINITVSNGKSLAGWRVPVGER